MTRRLPAFLVALVFAASTAAAQNATQQGQTAGTEPQPDETVKREEIVVVSASKTESTLVNAPATMSVVTPDVLAASPAQNYGDLLRSVPGLNVIQMSARDINITSRQSTSTLSNSQLALLDGRSIYLDFFGLILWDLVPANTGEIKQIEVVRGPASAVWGANALTGVVNIITKSPRDLASEGHGTFTLTAGVFDRKGGSRADDGQGQAFGGGLTFAQAPNERLSYKLSAGFYQSDPYSRPTGNIPLINDPRTGATCNPNAAGRPGCVGGAPYPSDRSGATGSFENSRTRQPKVDLRVDQEFASGGRLTWSAGLAGTEGIIHTGIGPFDLQSGSKLGYGRLAYSHNALKVAAFVNALDAKAPNLLLVDPATLQPVRLDFKTQTYDLEIGHYTVFGVGKRVQQVLSYGGNARRNNFEITLTPNAEDRNEFGAYVQDEIFFDKFRFTLGGRVDKFGNISDAVFSPRLTAMYKPGDQHSIRVSYNRAFRSPSPVNNFLLQDIFSPNTVNLAPLAPLARAFGQTAIANAISQPFFLRVRNVGNPDLREESLTAYELAYTGTFGDTTIGLAFYQNDSDDNINFTQISDLRIPPFDTYTAANAPALLGLNTGGTPVPGSLVAFLAGLPAQFGGPIRLPRTVSTYLNLGPLRQRGFEGSLNHNFTPEVSSFANYSFQNKPKPLSADSNQIAYPSDELAFPSRHRFNAGVNFNSKRYVASASVNYTSEAFWTDVLSKEYHGFTDAYTMFNATFGMKWLDGKFATTLKGTNLTNERVQQHVFGDIIKRSVFLELKANF